MAWAAVFALGVGLARAESGQPGAFLRQEAGARGAALGGALTALVDDSTALYWNPAGLARLAKPEVTGTHVVLFEDTSHDLLTFGASTRRWGGFAFAYARQSSGGFERRASPNDTATSFSISQSALSGGWGLRLPWAPLDVGLAVRSVREEIGDVSASGTAADLGLITAPWRGLSLGVAAHNVVAPELKFVSTPVKYPRQLSVSPAYTRRLGGDWDASAALRLSKLSGEALEPGGGVELRFRRFAAVRGGLQKQGLSTGAGLRFGNTQIDYAALLHDLGLSHRVTFIQRFGQTREEIEETIRRGISKLNRADAARLARAYLQKAEDDVKADRVTDALRSFESAALLDPGNESIPKRIEEVSARWDEQVKRQLAARAAQQARELGEQGSLLASRHYWQSVLELDADHVEARAALADIDRQLSQAERARLAEAHRAQEQAEVKQRLTMAETLLARGAFRQARAAAEELRKRFPDDPRPEDFLVELERRLRGFAQERLEAAAKEPPAEALRLLEAALKELPAGQAAAVRERVTALRAQLQRDVSPEARRQAEQLYYRAVEQYLKGNYQGASELAAEVGRLDPSSEPVKTLRDKIEAAQRAAR